MADARRPRLDRPQGPAPRQSAQSDPPSPGRLDPGAGAGADELWRMAQEQLASNRARAARNTQHEYLLRGLLICGHCGRRLVGTWTALDGRLNSARRAIRVRRRGVARVAASPPRSSKARCGTTSRSARRARSALWGRLPSEADPGASVLRKRRVLNTSNSSAKYRGSNGKCNGSSMPTRSEPSR